MEENVKIGEMYSNYENSSTEEVHNELRKILEAVNILSTSRYFGVSYSTLYEICAGNKVKKVDFATYCKVKGIDIEAKTPQECFFKDKTSKESMAEYHRKYYVEHTKPKREAEKLKNTQKENK